MSWVGGSVKKVCSKICALFKNLTLTSLCKIKPSPSKRKMGTILIVPPSLKWGNHPWDLKLELIDHYCLIFQIKACHHIDCEDFEGKNALPFCQWSVDKENFREKWKMTKFIPGKKSASKWCASTSSAVTESGGPSCVASLPPAVSPVYSTVAPQRCSWHHLSFQYNYHRQCQYQYQ